MFQLQLVLDLYFRRLISQIDTVPVPQEGGTTRYGMPSLAHHLVARLYSSWNPVEDEDVLRSLKLQPTRVRYYDQKRSTRQGVSTYLQLRPRFSHSEQPLRTKKASGSHTFLGS